MRICLVGRPEHRAAIRALVPDHDLQTADLEGVEESQILVAASPQPEDGWLLGFAVGLGARVLVIGELTTLPPQMLCHPLVTLVSSAREAAQLIREQDRRRRKL